MLHKIYEEMETRVVCVLRFSLFALRLIVFFHIFSYTLWNVSYSYKYTDFSFSLIHVLVFFNCNTIIYFHISPDSKNHMDYYFFFYTLCFHKQLYTFKNQLCFLCIHYLLHIQKTYTQNMHIIFNMYA